MLLLVQFHLSLFLKILLIDLLLMLSWTRDFLIFVLTYTVGEEDAFSEFVYNIEHMSGHIKFCQSNKIITVDFQP